MDNFLTFLYLKYAELLRVEEQAKVTNQQVKCANSCDDFDVNALHLDYARAAVNDHAEIIKKYMDQTYRKN